MILCRVGALPLILVVAAAGLNPWLTLLITAGLATFTRYAPLAPPFDTLVNGYGRPLLAVLALVLGIEVVVGKIPRFARLAERVDLSAAGLAGALLGAALPSALRAAGWPWAAAGGAVIAMAVRFGRRRAVVVLNQRLWRFGYIGVGIAANVLAGIATAAAFAMSR